MKKKIIIISIISILLICIIVGITLFQPSKKEEKTSQTIKKVTPLKESNPAEAAELIKKNTVKITNKISEETTIIGTGFLHESGYIITNSHIVDIKGEIKITYANEKTISGKLYSNEIKSDIALIEVEKPEIKAMTFADTLNLKITNDVYAIGYAYGLAGEATVTKGVLSARRSAAGIEFLQSDISLNTGNSGGPLINDKGELLGINTYATENASIGMSISSESLDIIINRLLKDKNIVYLEGKREVNALSVILKEIGYEKEDLYNENEILNPKKEEDKEKNEENKNDDKKEENHHHSEPKWNYDITPIENIIIKYNGEISQDYDDYFKLNDNVGCRIDLSNINNKKPGKYQVIVKCTNNSATNTITVAEAQPLKYAATTINGVNIPDLTYYEYTTGPSAPEGISGKWYYPGYSDICFEIKYDIDTWMYNSIGFDPWIHKIQGNHGGGGEYVIDQDAYIWKDGNYLIVTTKNYPNIQSKTYVLTRERGTIKYGTSAGSFCE